MKCRCCRVCAHGMGRRAVLEPSRAAASQCEMRAWTQTFPGNQPSVENDPDAPFLGCGGLEDEEKDVVWVQLQAFGEGAAACMCH